MIRRSRFDEPIPDDLVLADSVGQRELAAVKAWLDADRRGDRPAFRAYKAASVVRALERLFAGKCAYCESPYTRTQPVDVEHWRPKAEVDVPEQKDPIPGYAWLAASWDNLLPSCVDCNRRRRQIVLRARRKANSSDHGDGEFERVRIVLGKGNLFPLADETKRARTYTDSLARERPLIANPCTENPANLFHFRADGVVVPHPKADKNEKRRQRALASIEVYALNRMGLVDERRERILLLQSRFTLISALLKLDEKLRQPVSSDLARWREIRSAVEELIGSEIKELVRLTHPRQPYSLAMKQFVTAYLRTIGRKK